MAQKTEVIKEISSLAIVAEKFLQYTQIHTALYNQQRKNRPSIPLAIEEPVFDNEWAETESHDRYLLENIKEYENQMIVFVSDNSL